MEYETRVVSVLIVGKNGDLFDEGAVTATVEDEGGGEFVVLRQTMDGKDNALALDPEQWPLIVEAVGGLLKDIAAREVKSVGH